MAEKVAFNALKKLTVQDRLKAMKASGTGGLLTAALTPTDFANLFPKYYMDRDPDIGGFRAAITQKTQAQQERLSQAVADQLGIDPETGRRKGGWLDKMGKKYGEGPHIPKLSSEQEKLMTRLNSGPVLAKDMAFLGVLSNEELKTARIEKYKDDNGNEYYRPVGASEEEAIKSLKEGAVGKGSLATNQAKAYKELKALGYDDAAARGTIITMSGESLKDPTDTHPDGSSSDPSQVAHGIASWSTVRARKIAAEFPEAHGRLPNEMSVEEQIRAYDWELKTYYKDLYGKMRDPNISSADKSRMLTIVYENPAHREKQAENRINEYASKLNTQLEPEKPEGPNNTYSKEQIESRISELNSSTISPQRNREVAADLEKHGVSYDGQTATVNKGTEKLGEIQSYKSAGKGYCGIGTRLAARDLFGDKYFSDGLGKGGSAQASSLSRDNNYFQGSGYYNPRENISKERATDQKYLDSLPIGTVVSAQGGNADGDGHVQIKLGPHRWVSYFDQSGVLSERRDGRQYNGYSVHTPNKEGLEKIQQQGYATNIAATTPAPKQEPEEAHDVKQTSKEADVKLPDSTEQVQKEQEKTKVEAKQDTTATVEKPEKKPEGSKSFDLNRSALIGSIRQTDEFKSQAGIFASAVPDDTILNGFFADARTKKIMKDTGTTYDPATGKITSKDPDKLLKSFGDMDTSNILTPSTGKRVEAETQQQTATVGEKLQREFGVASAVAGENNVDVWNREEAYRKKHPYGPEMPVQQGPKMPVQQGPEMPPEVQAETKAQHEKGMKSNLVDYQNSKTGQALGMSNQEYTAFRKAITGIESGGGDWKNMKYNIRGGSSNRFSGAYQMGSDEIKEVAKRLGEEAPIMKMGRKTVANEKFLNDPHMQERYFDEYMLSHHESLMRRNKKYANMSPEQQRQALAISHNAGAGGASRWINTGKTKADAFKTDPKEYGKALNQQFAELKAQQEQKTQVAAVQQPTPTPTPTPTPEPQKGYLESIKEKASAAMGFPTTAAAQPTPTTTPTPEPSKKVDVPTPTSRPADITPASQPEFPKTPKTDVVPTPPARPEELKPQPGKPDETSTRSFLESQGVGKPEHIPVKATGGETKASTEVAAYPIGGLRGDNSVVVDTESQRPLFTMNTKTEAMVPDAENNKVNVVPTNKVNGGSIPAAPSSQTGGSDFMSELGKLREELTTKLDVAGDIIKQNPIKGLDVGGDIDKDRTFLKKMLDSPDNLYQTPSFKRAMMRSSAFKETDDFHGHYSQGNKS